MVKRGLIDIKKEEGRGFMFHLIPFVVGFYERQNAKIDKEFAELFEAYYHERFHKTMLTQPSVHRIIPLEKAIPVDIDVITRVYNEFFAYAVPRFQREMKDIKRFENVKMD